MEEMSVFKRSYWAAVMTKGSYNDARDLKQSDAAVLRAPAWFWNSIEASFHRLPLDFRDYGGSLLIIAPTRVEVYMRVLADTIRPIHWETRGEERILVFAVEIPRVGFFGCTANLAPSPIADMDLPTGEEAFLERVLQLMSFKNLFDGPLSPWTRYLDEENRRGACVPEAFLFESTETALDWLLLYHSKGLEGFEILSVPARWAGKRCFTFEAHESSERISA